MKQALKRHFVLNAMLAFLIVILLLVGSIAAMGYYEQEQLSDAFVDTLLEEDTRLVREPPPSWFGYQFTSATFPAGFYVVETDLACTAPVIDRIGILQDEEEDVETLAKQIVRSGATSGKVSAYKYRASYENGHVRLILLDQTTQIAALYNTIKTGVVVGVLCLLALFLILQPISGYVAGEWLRKAERQKQFITNAGHELKTPVAAILSNVEALELMTGETKYSRNIRQQSGKLDRMIKQLLMVERVDEMKYHTKKAKVNMTALVREECASFADTMQQNGLHLLVEAEEACVLCGYRESLLQLLNVLLDNASRYSSTGGRVEVKLRTAGRRIELSVANDVEAVPACAPQELFERFYRAGKRQNGAGCGVGLSAAQTIVELHHGRIRIEYPTEKFFRVIAALPLHG